MEDVLNIADDHRDDNADNIIQNCLDLKNPKSFFLFAGAGSGKTRSLVSALEYINRTFGNELRLNGRSVAVITYTNAACNEIKRRVQYNSLFKISTIHSFAWGLICSHTNDIRNWLRAEINEKINETNAKLSKSRSSTTKVYKNAEKKLVKLTQRLENLNSVKYFTYNPDGNNVEKNSLDHAEVIKLATYLLSQKETLQKILVDKYPILLIDESQDTQKNLISIFIELQHKYASCFSLGLLGDVMQRIYFDGKEDLHISIPDTWEKPSKIMNHRSRQRIVDLCNSIRKPVDGIEQQSRADKPNGFVRLFIASRHNPYETEQVIAEHMAEITSDLMWKDFAKIKMLTLEHQMAAERLGFKSFYEALDNVQSYKLSLKNGTLSAIGLFTHILVPLHKADLANNPFEKAKIVKEHATVYNAKDFVLTNELLDDLQEGVDSLLECWQDKDPTCKELLQIVYSKRLFPLSRDLEKLLENFLVQEDEDYQKISCLSTALDAPFSEVERYWEYVNGRASFDTHQGVKGLQFERVMVIIDDEAAKGHLFNYSKLFGVGQKSDTNQENEKEQKETTLDRTRRLLYVTCSRAMDSLAIVFYTDDIDYSFESLLSTGWFKEDEIIKLQHSNEHKE